MPRKKGNFFSRPTNLFRLEDWCNTIFLSQFARSLMKTKFLKKLNLKFKKFYFTQVFKECFFVCFFFFELSVFVGADIQI